MQLRLYSHTENVYLIYELAWFGQNVRPGDPVKIRRKGSHFRFIRLVRKDDEEWLECMDTKSGKCRKFNMNQFDGPATKRSRKHAA